jgi:GT2 family glycosyltransferase
MNPAVSVVIPTYDPGRFPILTELVATVQRQTVTPESIVVVVDHNDALVERATRELPGVTVLANAFGRGVSGNRNTGALHSATPLIAFLDDDTTPGDDWLERMTSVFTDKAVIGAGGALVPKWERPPTWVPDEFLWAFGASYAGLPTVTAPVRNVWSANMIVRRDAFAAVGGFRTDFGKVGDRSRPEDTELCLRMADATGGTWMYVPSAPVGHDVPLAGSTVKYFLTRCYNEGRGKVAMARLRRGRTTLGAEHSYLRSLPGAIGRGLRDTATGRDRYGANRAGAVVLGFAAAGAGGVMELLTARSTGD